MVRCSSMPFSGYEATDLSGFAERVLGKESTLLAELRVRQRLGEQLNYPRSRRAFASSFYFVRYGFYRHNFIVGARSGPDETFWAGLVQNLVEELGGFVSPTHNALYRHFLEEAGVKCDARLRQPVFAARFNRRWENYCRKAPFVQALAGIAVYEILDQPDYALLLEVVKKAGVGPKGLQFFEVHAHARHFELFEGSMQQLWKHRQGRRALVGAARFVNDTQRMMWTGLLSHLERTCKGLPRTPNSP